MCGRYVNPDEAAIERTWHIGRHNNDPIRRSFNVQPTSTIPVLRLHPETRKLELIAARRGLIPRGVAGTGTERRQRRQSTRSAPPAGEMNSSTTLSALSSTTGALTVRNWSHH
jgi:putative SOS response-associated peptidase YedK